MGLNIYDQIPFTAFYIEISKFTIYLSCCFFVISTIFLLGRKKLINKNLSGYVFGLAKVLLFMQTFVIFIFISAFFISLFYQNNKIRFMFDWSSTELIIPHSLLVMNLLIGIFSETFWIIMYKYHKNKHLESRSGFMCSFLFLFFLIPFPVTIFYTIGNGFSTTKILFDTSIVSALILYSSAVIYNNSKFSKYFKWAAFGVFLNVFSFFFIEMILQHYELYKARNYCYSTINQIEKCKILHGFYPSAKSINKQNKHEPFIVKEAKKNDWFYNISDEGFRIQLPGNPYIFYQYDEKSRKWVVYRSNMFY